MNEASPIAALTLVVSLLLHAAPVSAGRASTGGAGRGAAAAGRGASMETGGTGSGPVTGGRHARIRRPCGARGARCVGGGSSLDAIGFESESLLVVGRTGRGRPALLDSHPGRPGPGVRERDGGTERR